VVSLLAEFMGQGRVASSLGSLIDVWLIVVWLIVVGLIVWG